MRSPWARKVASSSLARPTIFGSWCKGSTGDFDSLSWGSNPCEPAKFMNVSHKVKWIWWASTRCASRSVSEVLKFYDFFNYSVNPPVNMCYDGYSHSLNIPPGFENYKLLMQVRNPYSRILSHWHLECFKKTPNNNLHITMPFADFAKEKSLQDFSDGLKIKKPDYIIRYEHLQLDVYNIPFIDYTQEAVLTEIKNNIVLNNYKDSGTDGPESYLKRDKTNNAYADWKSYYTQELADIVYSKHKDQFAILGYDKESWKV